jgi:UDP-N-acetylmuramoylalanine--D-glutamate ligase
VRIAIRSLTSLYGFAGVVVLRGRAAEPPPDRAARPGGEGAGDRRHRAVRAGARRLPPHKVVGITGTNGKSTTTALIHHIVRTAGRPVTMAGNIGYPILGQEPLPEGGVYVLELSSYQIDLTRGLDCDVSVLLNITPDHLDRYDGVDDYAASKARLFAMQSETHVAVIAAEDDYTRAIAGQVAGRKILVSSEQVKDQSRWPALQGPHNAQNIAAAVAAAKALGSAGGSDRPRPRHLSGLPHRMERVAEKNGVLFVNDSKATNPTSAAPALAAYPAVHWILGGLPKSDDLEACEPFLDHVRAAYTIGEAGPMFARLLREKVPDSECEMLFEAVNEAAEAARPGEVVLLSPACASFDQFRDYEARGDAFSGGGGGFVMGVVADLRNSEREPARTVGPKRGGRWFWEIDRVLLFFVAVLIAVGLIAVAAASPAAGQRLSGGGVSYTPLHYFYRQLVWIVLALPVMIGVSMLPRTTARRWCLIGTLFFTALLFLVPIIGVEVNGARRWLGVGFTQFQPSEFLKPLYVVSIAWMLSLKEQDASLPVVPLSGICTGLIALLLMQQPNFGETIIFASAFVMLLTLSGRRCAT